MVGSGDGVMVRWDETGTGIAYPFPSPLDGAAGGNGVNDAGIVVGFTTEVGYTIGQPAVWDAAGTGTVIGPWYEHADAISDSGWILGAVSAHTFWRMTPAGRKLTLETFGGAGGISEHPKDVNDHGQAVGFTRIQNGERAIRWMTDGTYEELPMPPSAPGGFVTTNSSGINNFGEVSGYWGTSQTDNRGVRWHPDGTVVVLPIVPGANSAFSNHTVGIEDHGLILGHAIEPATVAIWDANDVPYRLDQLLCESGWSVVQAYGIDSNDERIRVAAAVSQNGGG